MVSYTVAAHTDRSEVVVHSHHLTVWSPLVGKADEVPKNNKIVMTIYFLCLPLARSMLNALYSTLHISAQILTPYPPLSRHGIIFCKKKTPDGSKFPAQLLMNKKLGDVGTNATSLVEAKDVKW